MGSGQAIKNLLKRGIRAAVRTAGPLLDRAPAPTRILTYHSIGHRRYEMNVTPEAFAEQIAWLAEHHQVIPLADAAQGTPGVAITFDDGYRDNLTNALPILEQHACTATIFAVSGCLGGTLPFEKEPESGALLTQDELREAAARGLAIGGHTRSHARLSQLDPEAQEAEIAGCRSDLEQVLGAPVTAFAYPYGAALDYDATSVRLAEQAGYTLACSNRYGPVHPADGPFAIRRIWIDSTDTLASFQDKVSGRLDFMRLQDSPLGIRARRWLNRGLRTR